MTDHPRTYPRDPQPPGNVWIGADPGKTGGFVALKDDGSFLSYLHTPIVGAGTKARWRVDCRALSEWMKDLSLRAFPIPKPVVCIERVASMPHDGAVQAFRFGRATGALFAVAETLGYRITEISPKEWQKVFLAGYPKGTKGEIKASAALVASDRWPNTLGEVLRLKKNWGLADAALIADTARLVEAHRGAVTR